MLQSFCVLILYTAILLKWHISLYWESSGLNPDPLPWPLLRQSSTTSSQHPWTTPRHPLQLHLSSATCRDNCIPITSVPELPPVLRGHHQPSDQPRALGILCLPVHVLLLWSGWCGLERLCLIFSSPASWRENMLRNRWNCTITRWPNLLSRYQKTDCNHWENELNVMEGALHLEKSINQSLLELHKLATEKNDPHYVTLLRLITRMMFFEDLDYHVTNLCKMEDHQNPEWRQGILLASTP